MSSLRVTYCRSASAARKCVCNAPTAASIVRWFAEIFLLKFFFQIFSSLFFFSSSFFSSLHPPPHFPAHPNQRDHGICQQPATRMAQIRVPRTKKRWPRAARRPVAGASGSCAASWTASRPRARRPRSKGAPRGPPRAARPPLTAAPRRASLVHRKGAAPPPLTPAATGTGPAAHASAGVRVCVCVKERERGASVTNNSLAGNVGNNSLAGNVGGYCLTCDINSLT